MGGWMHKIVGVYTRLFAVWVVLFGVLAYFFPQPLQIDKRYNMLFFGITMFGIGAVLEPSDFRRIAARPCLVFLGTAAQYTLMPLGSFVLAKILGLSPELAVGLIVAGCAPGAMSSNVISYIAGADTAYSVSLTTVSTLLCPLVTPALTKWLAGSLLPVSFWAMVSDIVWMVLVPLAAGFAVRYFFGHAVEKIKEIFPAVSVTFIVFICSYVIANNRSRLLAVTGPALLAVCLLNLWGLSAGYQVARLFGLSIAQRRTLSIEIGMQNAGLGTALALNQFGPQAAVPTAFFVFVCIISAAVLVEIWKNRPPRTA